MPFDISEDCGLRIDAVSHAGGHVPVSEAWPFPYFPRQMARGEPEGQWPPESSPLRL